MARVELRRATGGKLAWPAAALLPAAALQLLVQHGDLLEQRRALVAKLRAARLDAAREVRAGTLQSLPQEGDLLGERGNIFPREVPRLFRHIPPGLGAVSGLFRGGAGRVRLVQLPLRSRQLGREAVALGISGSGWVARPADLRVHGARHGVSDASDLIPRGPTARHSFLAEASARSPRGRSHSTRRRHARARGDPRRSPSRDGTGSTPPAAAPPPRPTRWRGGRRAWRRETRG